MSLSPHDSYHILLTRLSIEGMELQKVGERNRQLRFILELHFHLDFKLAPALLPDFKREVVDHCVTKQTTNLPRWF